MFLIFVSYIKIYEWDEGWININTRPNLSLVSKDSHFPKYLSTSLGRGHNYLKILSINNQLHAHRVILCDRLLLLFTFLKISLKCEWNLFRTYSINSSSWFVFRVKGVFSSYMIWGLEISYFNLNKITLYNFYCLFKFKVKS